MPTYCERFIAATTYAQLRDFWNRSYRLWGQLINREIQKLRLGPRGALSSTRKAWCLTKQLLPRHADIVALPLAVGHESDREALGVAIVIPHHDAQLACAVSIAIPR